MIPRFLQNVLERAYGRRKIISILGPRQVGKSTLLSELAASGTRVRTLNCDNDDDRRLLIDKTSTELKNMVEPHDFFLIDEAQRVKNIGLTLKKIGDLHLDTHVIVTGSSSFDLADEINEPATGRLIEFNLYPLSLPELASSTSQIEEQRMLETRMIYGLYPEVVTNPEYARETLMNLTNNYLYRDAFTFHGMRKPDALIKLVRALALQIGCEVSYNELALTVGVDKATIENYINLLEKCFIIFRLNSFSRNARNEIRKGKKIYFVDNGVRNAVLSHFAPLELRNDCGMLWENLMISERVKRNAYHRSYAQLYFWRTHDQKEIDLIENMDGRLTAFEFKWNERKKMAMPASFAQNYPNSDFNVINNENFWPFLS
ncbi:MAG: ATP-binding protein [Muribaculaceae bacterium]|nr:ATP-binding protein [Muribaculaceae bacterium]